MAKPLENKKIVITRSENQAGGLVKQIEALGGLGVIFPTIKIRDADSWQACDNALRNIDTFDWIVFTSANAVYYFYQRAEKFEVRGAGTKIAAVGSKTAKALDRYGVTIDLEPDEFSARGLMTAFENYDLIGKRLLLPASNLSRYELFDGLRERGAAVERIEVYQTLPNDALDAEGMTRWMRNGDVDCLTFFSPSAFDFFVDLMGESVIELLKEGSVAIAAIGPTTAKAIEKRKLAVAIQPDRSTEEDFIKALFAYYSAG
jgi:uroporphyrinogen-III synthase